MTIIPYGKQAVDRKDIEAVVRVLKSDWLTQGATVGKFEQAVARYCGCRYAVAVSSGTAALHLAALAAGLKKGDEAITSPVTFLASGNAAFYAGAKPVFADIDPRTVNLDPEKLAAAVTPRTRAVIPVHFAGLPCRMAEIHRMARKKKIVVIEDAAHALGARYRHNGKWIKVGSCRHSDMTVFSFHPVKLITTGEGGMITTNNPRLAGALKNLRNHGMVKDKKTAGRGPWVYEMRDLGFNYRLTDIQSALGISQLKKISGFIRRRRQIVAKYQRAFSGLDGIGLPAEPDGSSSAWHLYVLRIDFRKKGLSRKQFMTRMRARGVGTQVHYIPLYKQPYYRRQRVSGRGCRAAENYYRECVSLPLYPRMSDAEVKRVIRTTLSLLKEGQR